MGIRNVWNTHDKILDVLLEFPSPCGEMGIRNQNRSSSSYGVTYCVSVPLRGNGYKEPYEVETVVIFSFQGTVAPNYGN